MTTKLLSRANFVEHTKVNLSGSPLHLFWPR
jgi:hypothetical protein